MFGRPSISIYCLRVQDHKCNYIIDANSRDSVLAYHSSCLHVCHEPNRTDVLRQLCLILFSTCIAAEIILCRRYNNIHSSSSQTAFCSETSITCRSIHLYLFFGLDYFSTRFFSVTAPRTIVPQPPVLHVHLIIITVIIIVTRYTEDY